MKSKISLALLGILILSILPLASADIIIPSITNVYVTQDGKEYNGEISFKITGYGYATGMPPVEKEPGSYTPEAVESFSFDYNEYGQVIYETYYRNYRHIDYFIIEGITENGREFYIDNIENIPTSSEELHQYIEYDGTNYYKGTDEWHSCVNKIIDEEGYKFDECSKYAEIISESELVVDDNGYPIDILYTLEINLDDAVWDEPAPVPEPKQGFFYKIGQFFRNLFKRNK